MYIYTIINSITQIEAVRELALYLAAAQRHSNVLRTNGNRSLARNLAGVREGKIAALDEYAVTLNLAVDEVNQTDKVCNHLVGRLGIDFMRRTNLLHNAHAHNNNAVTHSHCFTLVMGYINNGNASFLLNFQNFKAHRLTQLSIQVGQRLVKKQQTRLCYQRTCQRNTLLLATGKLIRITLAIFTQMYKLQHFLNTTFTLSLVYLLDFQRIANIFSYSHVRPNCIGLEYHADVAFFRRSKAALDRRAYAMVADINFALSCAFKACNHTQSRGLAAAGWTEDGNKFAILYN